VHRAAFKTSVQALMLLQQVLLPGMGGKDATPETESRETRFYRALYEKLRAPEVRACGAEVRAGGCLGTLMVVGVPHGRCCPRPAPCCS
jgi:hypothetical protein